MLERRWRVGLATLLSVGALGLWLLSPSTTPEPVETASPLRAPERPLTRRVQPAADTVPVDFVDGVPVRPAGSAEVNAEGMLPHPITPQHERIFHENNLIGDLNGAMDVKDVEGLRRLLKQYRDEFPEDAHALQRGYELIADCLERPGAETRAIAQRYYDEELDSGLRRYIRRHCLEGRAE